MKFRINPQSKCRTFTARCLGGFKATAGRWYSVEETAKAIGADPDEFGVKLMELPLDESQRRSPKAFEVLEDAKANKVDEAALREAASAVAPEAAVEAASQAGAAPIAREDARSGGPPKKKGGG